MSFLLNFVGSLIAIVIFSASLARANSTEIAKQCNFMSADYVEYVEAEQLIYAKGNIQIVLDEYFLSGDNLIYDIAHDRLWAEGNVMIKDKDNKIILGKSVLLKDKLKTGIISDFILYFGDNTLLVSKLAERVDENTLHLQDSTFTPCKILCNKKPIWQISAKNMKIDLNKNQVVYKHSFFEVWGVPILYTPYFSHPTPQAKARSGILIPKIHKKALNIPLYYRALPNLDFTLTPRIFSNYRIFELETRYKPNQSDNFNLEGSYGKVPYKITEGDVILKNRKINAYYILAKADLSKKGYNYGFQLERSSDKAYLKNYYQNYSSYLISRIYFQKIQHYNYFLMEGIHFEGLSNKDSVVTDPSIFPKIRTKNVIDLNDSGTSKLVVENNTAIYKEASGKELGRTALQISIDNNWLTSSGHLFCFILRNRTDVYFVNHLYPNDSRADKVLSRNIPEIQTIWRYPLASRISPKSTLLVEPIISLTIGRQHNSNKKFSFLAPSRYELSESKIFVANHYIGIDYHEFGNRLSYGINAAINSELNYFSLFLGQTYNTHFYYSSIYRRENIGKISANFSNIMELFYRFKKDKNFYPILDEIGGTISLDKFQFTSSFSQCKNLKKYYLLDTVAENKLRQLYYDFSYQLTNNWLISYNMRLDFPKTKLRVFSKSIQVTYLNDCVRIVGKLSDDYMIDKGRGIKKSSSPTISIGLKILNM